MQKLYYSIREVSELVDEEQHILRYWEKEFPELSPKKNRGGNRIYSEKDIAIIKQIKYFLREDKLSLKGAKEQLIAYLNNESNFQATKAAPQRSAINIEIKSEADLDVPISEKVHIIENVEEVEIVSKAPIVIEESKPIVSIVDRSALLDVRNFLQELLVEIRN